MHGLISLSGHNLRAVVALCRWGQASGRPVHLVARDAQDEIYLTDYAAQVVQERRSPALEVGEVREWISLLRQRFGYERVIVVPSTEFFNRFLLRHRSELEAAGALVPLVDEPLYHRISDKAAFADMCESHGLAVPRASDRLPEVLPCVAKPRAYRPEATAQVKPYLLLTPADRDRFLSREQPGHYFFQEFVEGTSIYLLAHIARNGQVTASAQENLVQQANGGSIILARPDNFHLEAEAQRYLRMLIEEGFHGLLMIEVRCCARSGKAVMIEANPRMWGPMQFLLDRHVDVFTPLFADHGLSASPLRFSTAPADYYFWSGGLSTAAASCSFHNFSAAEFVADFRRIAASDLLGREDTQRLYRFELRPT